MFPWILSVTGQRIPQLTSLFLKVLLIIKSPTLHANGKKVDASPSPIPTFYLAVNGPKEETTERPRSPRGLRFRARYTISGGKRGTYSQSSKIVNYLLVAWLVYKRVSQIQVRQEEY